MRLLNVMRLCAGAGILAGASLDLIVRFAPGYSPALSFVVGAVAGVACGVVIGASNLPD